MEDLLQQFKDPAEDGGFYAVGSEIWNNNSDSRGVYAVRLVFISSTTARLLEHAGRREEVGEPARRKNCDNNEH